MSWIKGIADALFDNELSQAKAERKRVEQINEHLHKRLEDKYAELSSTDLVLRAQRQEIKELKATVDGVSKANSRLVAENCRLTQQYVVPEVCKQFSGTRTCTGRIKKDPAYFAQLYGAAYDASPSGCLLDMDFSALERYYMQDVMCTAKLREKAPPKRPLRYYVKEKGPHRKGVNGTYNMYDVHDGEQGGTPVAFFGSRTIDGKTAKQRAEQHCRFLNSME